MYRITYINYLNFQTTVRVNEQSLTGCMVEDIANKDYYEIKEIIVVGKKNPWWKFESFNPMLKVKLNLEKINDKNVLQTLCELSKIPNIKILEGRY